MTYRELLNALSIMSSEDLDTDISVLLTEKEEIIKVENFDYVPYKYQDILEEQPIFFVDF